MYPNDTFSCAYFTRDDHQRQHIYRQSFKDIRFRRGILNTRGDHIWQQKNKQFSPITPVLVRIFQTLEVTIFGSTYKLLNSKTPFSCAISNTRSEHFRSYHNTFIPRTSVLVRVFQTSRRPLSAAAIQIYLLQGHPFFACISNTRGDHFWGINKTSLFILRTSFTGAYFKHSR